MIDRLDIAERSQTGPKRDEMDWNMGLFSAMTALAQEYEIRVPDEVGWFNDDDALGDRLFEAGLAFLVEQGVYCLTTGRVVQFTRQEVLDAIQAAPRVVTVGSGEDRRTLGRCEVEGDAPLGCCPGLHAPFDVETGPLVAEEMAALPRADFVEGFNFMSVDGHDIHGLPMEAYATRRQVAYMRQAVARAGRPDMAVVLYPLNTRIGALLPALDAATGLRPGDGMALSVLPDAKIEHDMLAAAIVADEYGLFAVGASFGIVGGFCGGVEGALIEAIVKPLVAYLVYGDTLNCVGVEDSSAAKGNRGLQPVAWARSLVAQALAAHTPLVTMALGFSRFGPGTEGNLIELAIRAIEAQINGGHLYVVRHSRAQLNAGQTPLEARWVIEVADATRRAGLDRAGAGRICRALHQRLGDPEPGHPIAALYDLAAHRPLPPYERLYRALRDDLGAMGLTFADQAPGKAPP